MIKKVRAMLSCVALFVFSACSSIPTTIATDSTEQGHALFNAAAAAHGIQAFTTISDISVALDSDWYSLIQRIQPELVDAAFRGGSEERILLRNGLMAQLHQGSAGEKYVLRRWRETEESTAGTRITRNGVPDTDPTARDAAAIVADAYRVFLLGPLNFSNGNFVFEDLGITKLNGRTTDRLLIQSRPGLGNSPLDRFILFIDRDDRLMRRVWFTLEGLASTQGAVVEVNVSDYREIAGVQWPTRFYERIRRPIPFLPAHRWQLLGLDVNRGMTKADLLGPTFTGAAQRQARRLD